MPGKDIAKPVLKIGEPFNVSINLTVYQKSEVSVMLSEIGNGDFIILDGSTKKMNTYGSKVTEKNSSEVFEWTVAPTENWAGGALPIDLVYQINDFETGKILVNSGFTIAYPYITNEYYKDEIPASNEQPVSQTSSSSTSASTPAFKFAGSISVFALALLALSRR